MPSKHVCNAVVHAALPLIPPNQQAHCHFFVSNPPRPPHPSISITLQPAHDLGHGLLAVDAEALVLGDAGELHVLGVELLLHDLLEGLEHELFGLLEGEGAVVFGLELGLGAFGAGADRFRVVAVEGARGFGVVAVGLGEVDLSSGAFSWSGRQGWGGGVLRGVGAWEVTYSCGPSSSQPAINSATPNGRDMMLSSPSAPSPNLKARSQMAWVQLSTPSFSL
jgi:hypothetical protein